MASPSPDVPLLPPTTSFSISLGPAKPKPAPRKSAPTFAPKRSAAHLGSDDEDHHDEHAAKVQLVTGFDATRGGALDLDDAPKQPQGPLVIPKQSNRNWREEAERRRGGPTKKPIYLPPEALTKQNGIPVEDLDVVEQKYGLQVFDRRAEDAPPAETAPVTDATPPLAPKTEEELALASLLRGDAPAPSTLVLAPSTTAIGNDWRAARSAVANEDAAFKTDVASRPEMASLEDYAAVPVEEFGAALLRGMGWKEGDEVGKRRGAASKPRVVEKRPAFLGIGAKAKEEVPELGTWGKGDKRRRGGRQDTTYVPVIMVDKKTGRIVEPAEAEAVAAAAAAAATNGSGKGELEKNDRERDRDREPPKRERSRDRGSRTERTERRDRERSYDSSDRRRRDRSGRDKESGRDRDRERDRDRDSGRGDRERSNRKDNDRDRRRGDDRRRDERRDRDRRDRR